MNIDIDYKGLTNVPSEYNAADGELSLSLNCIPEHGSLKPILNPTAFLRMPYGDGNECCVFIHKGSGFANYIMTDNAVRTPEKWRHFRYATSENAEWRILGGIYYDPSTFVGCNAVGNVLMIFCEQTTHYFLWKDGSYRFLGNQIPDIQLSFGLVGHPRLYSVSAGEGKKFKISFDSIKAEDYFKKEFSDDNKRKITEQIMAKVNKFIADQTTNAGRFCFPFFVRYALRLYDGTHVHHSAPILMCPSTTAAPVVTVSFIGSSSATSAECDIMLVAADLDYALANTVESWSLGDWKDIVSAIDVFVSKPLYNFDINGKIDSVTDDNDFFSTFIGRLYSSTLPSKTSITDAPAEDKFLNPLDMDCEDKYMEWPYSAIYAMYFNKERNFWAHTAHLPEFSEERKGENIRSCANFYKLTSISLDDISVGKRKSIIVPEDYLQSLLTRESLSDDYQSHDTLLAQFSHVFNSRLNLAGMSRRLFNGFRPDCVFAYTDGVISELSSVAGNERCLRIRAGKPRNVKIEVYIREGGKVHHVNTNGVVGDILSYKKTFGTTDNPNWENEYTKLSANSFFFYPNPNAVMAVFHIDDAVENPGDIYGTLNLEYRVPLTPHDFLNGAYAFIGFNEIRHYNGPEHSTPAVTSEDNIVEMPNKIYTSEVSNPFYFPIEGINTVGTGEIIGIATASKALSEGQFGQFPLYAFTSDGVWALQTNDRGLYSARQPISRDVCVSSSLIAPIDSAVVFATQKGIMVISGSEVQCISDAIASPTPFDPWSLPHADKLHEMLRLPEDDSYNDNLTLLEYIAEYGAGMIYDYLHSRVIVYSPQREYVYVYSLSSGTWATAAFGVKGHLNSYPQALAIMGNRKDVYDFAVADNPYTTVPMLAITRPLKLGMGDVLKSIDSVIQRGVFAKHDVASILYGSRDLQSWHMIWSSKDRYLRGFRGTPYKYFRIGVMARLTAEDSISGASIQFTPKYTNKPR